MGTGGGTGPGAAGTTTDGTAVADAGGRIRARVALRAAPDVTATDFSSPDVSAHSPFARRPARSAGPDPHAADAWTPFATHAGASSPPSTVPLNVGATTDASAPAAAADTATALVERLIELLAPRLGLDPHSIRLDLHPGTDAPHGRASPDGIELSGDPHEARVAAVTAHELAHVRQHRNRARAADGAGPESFVTAPDATAAEAEAAGIAAALRAGRTLWHPTAVLPAGRAARDGDATGIAPVTTTPGLASLELKLQRLVETRRLAERRALIELLDHPHTQHSVDMTENCLRVLSRLPFVVARALVRTLPPNARTTLAVWLTEDRHAEYPEACLAVLSALSEAELTALAGLAGSRSLLRSFEGMDPTRLSEVATRALLATLLRMPLKSLQKLIASNRDRYRPLLSMPLPPGTDAAQLEEAIRSESDITPKPAGDGDAVVVGVRLLLAERSGESAERALTRLVALDGHTIPGEEPAPAPSVDLDTYRPTLEDLRAEVAKLKPAGAGTNAPPTVSDRLRAVVAQLDAEGLVDRLVDDLGEDRRRSGRYGPALKLVLAARAPQPNLARASELLSYHVFDWAVRDSEARLAYLFVRSAPIAAQDAWRLQEDGKWLGRLLDNLPEDVWSTGEYTGVGSEFTTGGTPIGIPETMLLGHARGIVDEYARARHPLLAKRLVHRLLGLTLSGAPSRWIPNDAATDLALRTAVVRRLDALQGLDELVTGLPDDAVFGEVGRTRLLELGRMRDPVHVMRFARDLIPEPLGFRTFFSWIGFTHRDAWIAALALLALPPAAQRRFAFENPDLWPSLWDGLTAEMRRNLPSTLAAGGDPSLPSRDAIRARIADERMWTEANALRLRSLILLAYAADDRAWVFDLSRRLRVDARLDGAPQLARMVEDLRLYNESKGRTLLQPIDTDPSRAPTWGSSLGVIARGIGFALGPWLFRDLIWNRSIKPFGKTMRLKGFELDDVQTIMGGDLSGAELAPSGGGTNTVDVAVTFSKQFLLDLSLPKLRIKGVNLVRPGKTYKTGPITIDGLQVAAGFSDRGYTKPAYVRAKLASLALQDFTIVDPALPVSGAWAVAGLATEKLGFTATPDGTLDPAAHFGRPLPTGTVPIPVFGPLIQLLANLVALKGSIPGDYTLLDYAMLPLRLPFPVSTLASQVANRIAPTPQPLSYVWGLASDGVWRPPYSAAQRARDSIGTLRAFDVSFTKLQVDGISMGAEQQLGSLVLTDVHVAVGQSLPAYLRGALGVVRAAKDKLPAGSPKRAELAERIRSLEIQLEAAEGARRADERRLQELEGKDRWEPGSLEDGEREELVRLTKQLRSDVGMVAEIGSIALGPLTGRVEAPGVTLTGIHAHARLPDIGLLPASPGYLDDQALIDRFRKGGDAVPSLAELARASEFRLVVDRTELLPTNPAQPALTLRADALPTVAALRDELHALPVLPANAPVRERLERALVTLVELEKQRSLAARSPADAASRAAEQQVRELDDLARRQLGLEIGGLTFGRITGELDPRTQHVLVAVDDVVATRIAGRGFAIDSVTGRFGATLRTGDVATPIDQLGKTAPATLAGQLRPGLSVNDLEARGVKLGAGAVARVRLGSLTGSLQVLPDGAYRVPDLVATGLEADGIAIGTGAVGLAGEHVGIDRMELAVAVRTGKSADGTSALTGATIESLRIGKITGRRLALDLVHDDGTTTHAELKNGALTDIVGAGVEFEHGSTGWELVKASGSVGSFDELGFVVATGAVASRTTVSGTLTTSAAGRAAGRASLAASYARGPDGATVSLALRDLQLLNADVVTPDGSVRIQRALLERADHRTGPGEAEASAVFRDFRLGAIRWKVGTATLRGPGPVTVATINVKAGPAPGVEPAPGAAPPLVLTELELVDIAGAGLTWDDPPRRISLGRSDRPDEPPLTIRRILLRPAAKTAAIESLSVNLEGKLAAGLGVKGSLAFDSMTAELRRGDRAAIVVRGLSADATLSGDLNGTVLLTGMSGAVEIGPDEITIGSADPKDPAGLRVDLVRASSLDITYVMPDGEKVHLQTPQTGRIDLVGITARARIGRRNPPVPGRFPFTRIAIDSFHVDLVILDGIKIDGYGHTVLIPPADKISDLSFISDFLITPPTPADPKKPQPGFVYDFDTGAAEGTASISGLGVTVAAKIKDTFDGQVRLSAGLSSFALSAAGGLRIDVSKPKLTMEQAAKLPGGKGIRVAELGADKLSFADGKLSVEKAYANDLEFTLDNGKVRVLTLKVRRADLDKLDYKTADGGSLEIPALEIDDAFLDLRFWALPKSSTTAGGADPVKFDPANVRPLLDSLDGDVWASLYISKTILLGRKDIRIGSAEDPVHIPISKGAVDILQFERNIRGKVKAIPIESGWHLRPWVIEAVAKDPELILRNNQLMLEIYYLTPTARDRVWNESEASWRERTRRVEPFLVWDLQPVDVRTALDSRFSVWAAVFSLHSEPPKTQAELDAMTEDQRKEAAEEEAALKDVLDSLELRRLKADLSFVNETPIPLAIDSPSAKGTLRFGEHAMTHLRIDGGLPAVVTPWGREGRNPHQLGYELEGLAVDSVDLTLTERGDTHDPKKVTGSSQLRTGKIGITGMSGKITFLDMKTPWELTGRVTTARAEGIRWSRR